MKQMDPLPINISTVGGMKYHNTSKPGSIISRKVDLQNNGVNWAVVFLVVIGESMQTPVCINGFSQLRRS